MPRASWLHRVRFALPLVLTVLAACSSDTTQKPVPDTSTGQTDGSALFPCSGPTGASCNAHDSCVLSAVCKEDGRCHPEQVQNCDDDLDCTVDTCKGPGVCDNVPKDGFCVVSVKGKPTCFADKAANPEDPCLFCDAKASGKAWSSANGGACDDGNLCTKDDYCQSGVCKGTAFSCDDQNACTQDVCDGKGGCTNPPKTNICTIAGGCQNPGDKVTGGCGSCDPQKSITEWTLLADKCFVDNVCYNSGQKAPVGCSTCDPAKDQRHFSPPVDICEVGACVAKGAKGTSGCTICDPTASALDWSAVTGATVDLTNFESGLGAFVASAATNSVGWQVWTGRAHAGTQSLYYGNPAKKNYNSGSSNSGTATRTGIALPAGKKAALVFWVYMDTETSASYDILTVEVGGTTVWKKDSTTMPSANFKRWVPVEVILSSYAGTSINLVFKFSADATLNNTEGVYVDDVRIITECGAI
jgi:hypothetical protein